MEVVGEAAYGRQATELARTHHPDVVVMDIRMPGIDGLAATEPSAPTRTWPTPASSS